MCEPISALAAVGSLAAAGINYMGQEATLKAQNQANDDWVAYQRRQAAEAGAKDEELRKKADAARASTMDALNPQNQQDVQAKEAARLEGEFLGNNSPAAPDANIAMLSGQGGATSKDIQSRVSTAAQEARKRIAALAQMSAYGNSFGGIGQNAALALGQGNEDIGMTSDKRTGVTNALKVAQAVPVAKYEQGSNIAGSIASGLANIAGTAAGAKLQSGGFGIGR